MRDLAPDLDCVAGRARVGREPACSPVTALGLNVDADEATFHAENASISARSAVPGVPPPRARPTLNPAGRGAARPGNRPPHGAARGRCACAITREPGNLAEVGVLKRETRGNRQMFSGDSSGPIFTELASIVRKTSGLADVPVQALEPLAPQRRVAFVFGSLAQGREAAGSDIDVMLIGNVSFREVVDLVDPTQAVPGREVNPKVIAADELTAKVSSVPFLADVLAKPGVFLIGSAHDLEELARHQP
jgi:predicted nucleotidyltransferase